MKTKIIHPLWIHLPATGALVVLVVYLISSSPLHGRIPVHFGFGGEPDAYGSPGVVFGLVIGLSVFFILLSTILDELWARQEEKKAFNWLSLFDDIVVGAMSGTYLGYLAFLGKDGDSFNFPWEYILMQGGIVTILAVILEIVRPYRSYTSHPSGHKDRELKAELNRCLEDNLPFFYWDYQNPVYVTLLTTLLPLLMMATGALIWLSQPWASILLFVIGVLLIIPYGGQRTLVTRQNVTVRFGILGIKVLRLRMEELSRVETHEFAPLRDFGGYGIRFNREMKAYFLRGTRGVKLTSTDGKKYLIGSNNSDRLATIIDSVTSASVAERT